MPTMNVSLTDDLNDFVAEQLGQGYNTQSEVVRDSLRLLRARNSKLRAMRAAIDLGLGDVDRGDTKRLTDDVLHDIAARGKKRAEPKAARPT
jgi:antitoxin ParD1/3/4